MATVPQYEQQTQRLQAVPNVQQSSIASPELFTSMTQANNLKGIGQGLGNVAEVIDKHQQELDAATALNAEVTTREKYIEFQNQARSRRGLAADGLTKDTEKWWEETARTTTEKMTPNQKKLYVERLRGTRLSTLSSMSEYQDGQVRAAKQEGAQASMASTIKLAQDDPTNAGLLADALRNIQITTSRLGAENGDAPEKVQIDMLTRTSTLHEGILGQIVDTNPKAAREYMDKYGAQMTPAARGHIAKTLEVSERNQKVMGEVGTAMAKPTEAEALSYVREKFANDADAMKQAVNEVKTQFNERDDELAKYQKVAFDRAWTLAIDSGKGRKGVDAATWAALNPQQRDSIEDELYSRVERVRVAQDRVLAAGDRALARQDRIDARKEKATEKAMDGVKWDNYYALRQQAGDNPNAFKSRDLREVFNQIPKEKREELIDLQQKKPEELKDVSTLDKQIGLYSTKISDKDDRNKFEMYIRNEVFTEQKNTGKSLNEEQRQKIIDRALIKGEIPYKFNDEEGSVYELRNDPNYSKFIPEIPDTEKEKIKAAIISDKKPVTDAEVMRRFKLKNRL